jgi:hypothetical protein
VFIEVQIKFIDHIICSYYYFESCPSKNSDIPIPESQTENSILVVPENPRSLRSRHELGSAFRFGFSLHQTTLLEVNSALFPLIAKCCSFSVCY